MSDPKSEWSESKKWIMGIVAAIIITVIGTFLIQPARDQLVHRPAHTNRDSTTIFIKRDKPTTVDVTKTTPSISAGGATKDTVETPKSKTPHKISDENYACGRNNGPIRIIDREGQQQTVSAPGSSGRIYIGGPKIIWYCGNSQEDWDAPSGTQYIIVSRKDNGAGVVEYYYED